MTRSNSTIEIYYKYELIKYERPAENWPSLQVTRRNGEFFIVEQIKTGEKISLSGVGGMEDIGQHAVVNEKLTHAYLTAFGLETADRCYAISRIERLFLLGEGGGSLADVARLWAWKMGRKMKRWLRKKPKYC